MKRLVIFDLDGTLLDTIGDLARATNHALNAMGFKTHPLGVYPMLVGNGVTKLIERALPEEERSEATIEAMHRHFTEFYGEHCADTTRPYPGIERLLSDLTAEGISVAVASNKYQEATAKLISTFFPDVPWVAVEGHREGVPTKPDPSIVFEILSGHPTPKAEVLYVGDSGVDMDTAFRACVESCGVTWGFRSREELERHHADHIVSDTTAILRIALGNVSRIH